MLNSLRSRMVLLILGGTFFSILLVSVLANYTIFKQYDRYMEKEQQSRIDSVIELIESSYSEKEGWTEEALEVILYSPMIKNIDLALWDNHNALILQHESEMNFMERHHKMMGMHHSSMMNKAMDNDNYITEKYVLKHQEETIGVAEIGTNASLIISEQDVTFTKGINNSIFYAAILSSLFAIVFGLWSAHGFSKPIIDINKTTQEISRGNLGSRITLSNNITEIKELSHSINSLASSLEKQENLRKQLTSDISHELRTPIAIIQSQIEAIGDGLWDLTPERIQTLNEESNRLLKLVSQLKYLTQIENHQESLDIRRINLSNLVKEVLESFQVTLNNTRLVLQEKIQENIWMEGDGDKLKQVVLNLISNSVKFTNAGGIIEISLKQNKELIHLIAKDNGMGISKENLPHIFERFYKSDQSRNRNTGGTGIGLTIVKSIIDAHKGTINVTSKEGEGTEFCIELPKHLSPQK